MLKSSLSRVPSVGCACRSLRSRLSSRPMTGPMLLSAVCKRPTGGFSFDDHDDNDEDDYGFGKRSSGRGHRDRDDGYGGGGFHASRRQAPSQSFGRGGSLGSMSKNDRFELFRSQAQIDWNSEALTPFKKDFYREHSDVAAMSESEVNAMREELAMKVSGKSVPKPFRTWDQCGLPQSFVKFFSQLGISSPTAIQSQGIPVALSGGDMVGVSQTGSGKTLAYTVPLMLHIQAQPVVKSGEGPIGLILAPTRELAQQIDGELHKLCRAQESDGIVVKHCAVYGGADRQRQIHALRRSPDILVATPGRLIDLVSCAETNFKRTTYLVLDEADRMLDMGFREDLRTILSYVRPDKQTLMWSATWPTDIQDIAASFMSQPIKIQIGSLQLQSNSDVQQHFKFADDMSLKKRTFVKDLQSVMKSSESGKRSKVLVFCNTKRGCDELAMLLEHNDVCSARAIHGDKTQAQRESILGQFRDSRVDCLIATDVVARGIDIRDIAVVVCFDFPTNVEDYVHRIGRTGRAGSKGVSLAYLSADDIATCGRKLIAVLKNSQQEIPDFLEEKAALGAAPGHARRGGNRFGGNRGGNRRW